MRIYASKTSRGALLAVALCAASWLVACSSARKPEPPRSGPPIPIIVVSDHGLTLRWNQRLELHAMLSAAARNDSALAAALEPARAPYARVFGADDDDAILLETSRGIEACADAGCDLKSLTEHGLDGAFLRAEPAFAMDEKQARAKWALAAIGRAHASFDERHEGALATLSKDLGMTPGAVDIVAESPPVGGKGLLTPLLAANGPCFASAADTRVNNTRIVDCVIVRALLAGKRPAGFSERFFTVAVVHAVALTMTAFEPKHLSVDRRAVAVAEPAMLSFVTAEWRGTLSPDLENRYLARLKSPDSAPEPDAPASH